jgi:gas vesicle protein
MSDDRGSGSSVILSFLLGGLTGAALAILFAPRSGEETRELLSEKLRDGADRGRQWRDRTVARGREVLEDASGYVEGKREAIEKNRDRLAAAVEAGRKAFRDEKDKM